MPVSYSATVTDTASTQKQADCDVLKPEPIPSISQQLIDTLPAKLDGETEFGYTARLDEHQRAIYEWFNANVRNGKRWQVFCST